MMRIEEGIIDEALVLENKEGAKISDYRANWLIDETPEMWMLDDITNTPIKVLVNNKEVDFNWVRDVPDYENKVVVSWDMDFDSNERVTVKILTETNANIPLIVPGIYKETSVNWEFPYNNNNSDFYVLLIQFGELNVTMVTPLNKTWADVRFGGEPIIELPIG